jgi:hypothetical protein
MHYLILATTFMIACYSVLNFRARSMIYQEAPVNKRRRRH